MRGVTAWIGLGIPWRTSRIPSPGRIRLTSKISSGWTCCCTSATIPTACQAWTDEIAHSHTDAAAHIAAAAGVKRLVLIHKSPIEALDIHPDLAAARRIFANTEIAEDGMELDF